MSISITGLSKDQATVSNDLAHRQVACSIIAGQP